MTEKQIKEDQLPRSVIPSQSLVATTIAMLVFSCSVAIADAAGTEPRIEQLIVSA